MKISISFTTEELKTLRERFIYPATQAERSITAKLVEAQTQLLLRETGRDTDPLKPIEMIR